MAKKSPSVSGKGSSKAGSKVNKAAKVEKGIKEKAPSAAKSKAPVAAKDKKISTLQAKNKTAVATAEVPVDEAKPKKVPKKTKAEIAAEKLSSEDAVRWLEYKNKHSGTKALNYSMSGKFEAQTPILHKVLGWGYILSNQNDRLEVIFEKGTKILISNYKTN